MNHHSQYTPALRHLSDFFVWQLAYILWPRSNTPTWQQAQSAKLALISGVYRAKEQFAGSFMCQAARCSCGVAVMMPGLILVSQDGVTFTA